MKAEGELFKKEEEILFPLLPVCKHKVVERVNEIKSLIQ